MQRRTLHRHSRPPPLPMPSAAVPPLVSVHCDEWVEIPGFVHVHGEVVPQKDCVAVGCPPHDGSLLLAAPCTSHPAVGRCCCRCCCVHPPEKNRKDVNKNRNTRTERQCPDQMALWRKGGEEGRCRLRGGWRDMQPHHRESRQIPRPPPRHAHPCSLPRARLFACALHARHALTLCRRRVIVPYGNTDSCVIKRHGDGRKEQRMGGGGGR